VCRAGQNTQINLNRDSSQNSGVTLQLEFAFLGRLDGTRFHKHVGLAHGRETRQSRVPMSSPTSTSISSRVSLRVSLPGPGARAATSSNSFGLWLVAGRMHDNFYDAPPGSPCTHDLRGHPNYGNRDDENHRPVLVCLPGVVALP
jgi:hypothetical protein